MNTLPVLASTAIRPILRVPKTLCDMFTDPCQRQSKICPHLLKPVTLRVDLAERVVAVKQAEKPIEILRAVMGRGTQK